MTIAKTLEESGITQYIITELCEHGLIDYRCCRLREICGITDLSCKDFIAKFLTLENVYNFSISQILNILGLDDCFETKKKYCLKDEIIDRIGAR